jgi:hypothetical protein
VLVIADGDQRRDALGRSRGDAVGDERQQRLFGLIGADLTISVSLSGVGGSMSSARQRASNSS